MSWRCSPTTHRPRCEANGETNPRLLGSGASATYAILRRCRIPRRSTRSRRSNAPRKQDDIAKMLLSLPECERSVIELRYRFVGDTHTLDAIGRAFGLTSERVRQLETQ